MEKIVPAFENSLFDPSLNDACIELGETGIDSFVDNDIVKSVPVLRLLIGVTKTGINIHDRNLLKQTVTFLNNFNAKTIDARKLQKYLNRIKNNRKYAEAELGRVMICLNSFIDTPKSQMLARLYRAYIEEKIDWDKFCELSDVISRVFFLI